MDDTDTSMGELNPGISIRNGPVEAMDVDPPATNGNGIKRKSSMNGKSYKDTTESDDDDVPLVRRMHSVTIWQDLTYHTDQT
jgi:DNA topoisomerase-1